MTREQRYAHRRRIGKFFRAKGEKIGLSLTVLCLMPPPGETVPPELAGRKDIMRWTQDEAHLADKYLRAFKPRYPTRYQARKLVARLKRHYPKACNYWLQPSYRLYGCGHE
jgi:hypothetical protein